ncbi:MAG: DUF4089 domain-containing protein [Geminicoccaceae bacterium]
MTDPAEEASAGFAAEAHLDAMAALLGLAIAPEHRPGVVRNLLLIAEMGGLVMGLKLPGELEPAPVFLPAEPGA